MWALNRVDYLQMKIRISDSDGIYCGGLFKTDVFNALNCRLWPAPPHPHYDESLIYIAGYRSVISARAVSIGIDPGALISSILLSRPQVARKDTNGPPSLTLAIALLCCSLWQFLSLYSVDVAPSGVPKFSDVCVSPDSAYLNAPWKRL